MDSSWSAVMQRVLCDSVKQQGQGMYPIECLLAGFFIFYCMVGVRCNSFLQFDSQRENGTVLTQHGTNSL